MPGYGVGSYDVQSLLTALIVVTLSTHVAALIPAWRSRYGRSAAASRRILRARATSSRIRLRWPASAARARSRACEDLSVPEGRPRILECGNRRFSSASS